MNYLGIEEKKLSDTVKTLNALLADLHIYYQNLRMFHWNIQGENFFDLHQRFEELYNDAKIKIDDVAERILTLRHQPVGNLSVYLKNSSIEEVQMPMSDRDMVEALLYNHAQLIERMRTILKHADEISDEGTLDMIAGFLADIEKKSWMLDSWRSKKFQAETASIF